jgi:enoyl-CoA hydratase
LEITSHIEYNVADSVGIITFNDPKGYNFITWKLIEEIGLIQDQISTDNELRAVILQSDGKHFSAGINFADLKLLDSTMVMRGLPANQRIFSRWQELNVPVIAAVNGLCFGIATELILGCDIRIASDDAQFSIQEVRFGLSPDHGGTTRLTHLVGTGQAKRMIMNCEQINSAEAKTIGLVETVVANNDLHDYAMKMARNMCNFPPAGLCFAKKGINLAAESSVASGLFFEQAQATYCCGTDDQKEAINAYIEKRKPVYKKK